MSERLQGMVASAVVEVASDSLVAALGDPDVTNAMRGNLVEMMDMTMILPMLEDAAERRSTREEEDLRLCLPQLEDVAYDILDMVEEIRTNKDPAPMADRMLPLSVSPISNKISVIRQALHKIRQEKSPEARVVVGRDDGNQSCPYDEREATSRGVSFDGIFEPYVVGRGEQVERILDFLLSPAAAAAAAGMSDDGIREWPVFVPIFGLAGIGKTTLAKLVYKHRRSRDYFDVRAWVCVSPSFDLRRIGASIISEFPSASDGQGGSVNVLDDLDSITRRIHELLVGKKVLLVLDDIWEQDQQELDRLKSLLGQAGNRVTVLVTTRDEDIARRICCITNNKKSKVQPYKVHPLSDDQCWEVIKLETSFESRNDRQDLDERIGREMIAAKCGGLPLAAHALGFRLRSIYSYEEWLQIASTHYYNYVVDGARLSQSYQSMPPNVRLCFAYLGTLPESERQNMAEDDIIHRWIALGLIEPTNGISTGQQIISRLLDISFLEHSNNNLASTSRKHDDKGIISYSMHSLIYDFARSLMSSTLVVADGEHTRDPARRRCRCAVLTNFVPSKLSGMLPAELRSLSLLGCSKMELSNDSLSFDKLRYLRVLQLREASIQKLSDSICQLGLLGYLNLSGCSGLKSLPESFGNLTGLVYINLSGCHGLDDLPKSFSKLNKLEHLDLSSCSCLRELPEALRGLTNLRHLNLSDPCYDAVEHKECLEKVNQARAKVNKLEYPNCHNTSAKEGLSRKIAIPELEGDLASVVVKVTHDMLASVLEDAAVTIRHKKLVPKMIYMMMQTVAACMSDTKRWSRREVVVRLWLKFIETVAYDIWDMVADMEKNNRRAAQIAAVLHCCVVGPKVTKINKVIESLRKILEMFNSVVIGRPTPDRPSFGLQETSSFANMDLIVGRDDETHRILHILLGSRSAREKGVILPIFGLAGVGKTTLAQLVYNHDTAQLDYDARVWVYVSPDFDLIRIGKSIIQGLGKERYDVDGGAKNHLESMKQCLSDLLCHRTRVLIVLDDILGNYHLDLSTLGCLLMAHGSKVQVLVTTRDEGTARRICTSNVEPYRLHPLSHDVCWQIIKQSSRFEARDDKQELQKIGLEIASKCEGLPLAAQALGFKLTDRGIEGWSRVRSTDDLFDVYFGDGLSEWNNRFVSSVSLSYGLMLPTERLCFAYLATLPHRLNMAKDDIIYSWIALVDLMEERRQCGEDIFFLRNRGEDIFQKLLDISFLQDANNLASAGARPLSAAHAREKKRTLTMNNVVNSLARYVLGERLVVVDGRNMAASSSSYVNSNGSGLFAVVSNVKDKLENLSSILPDAGRILSLRFVGCSNIKISAGAFSSAKKLRLLDLRGCLDNDFLDNAYWPLRKCSIGKLPESIGQLKHLRYLNAPAIADRVLPLSIINGLSGCLRYLSLRCSRQLSDLTEAFGSMKSLLHLDLSGCSGLTSLPKSFGACWRYLQHLDLSGCTGLKALPQSVRKVGSGSSSELRHLDLSGCSCLEGITEALSGCTHLRYLNLSHRCGYSVEDWFHLKGLNSVLPKLKELRFLGISSCLDPFCYAMPAEESSKYVNCIASLDKLEHLDLSRNKFLRHLPEKIGDLKELRTLDLSMCFNFKLESLQGIGKVNKLRVLEISGCPQLNPLPEETQRQLAKLPFLESRESHTSITGPSQASGSQQERSLIVGGNQVQDWARASTSQDAARQPRISSEPEITEIAENH